MSLFPYYSILQWELEQMSRYLDTLQDSLVSARDEFFESLDQYDLSENELVDAFYDDIVEVRDDYPQLFYSSFVLTWFTFIEKELIRICHHYNRDLRGDKEKYREGSIDTSRNFLKEEVNYLINDRSWQKLKFIQKVRNHIAHGNAEFRFSFEEPDGKNHYVRVANKILGDEIYLMIEPNFYKYLEEQGIIQFSGPYFNISPTYDFCKHLVDFGAEFLSEIFDDLKLKKQNFTVFSSNPSDAEIPPPEFHAAEGLR